MFYDDGFFLVFLAFVFILIILIQVFKIAKKVQAQDVKLDIILTRLNALKKLKDDKKVVEKEPSVSAASFAQAAGVIKSADTIKEVEDIPALPTTGDGGVKSAADKIATTVKDTEQALKKEIEKQEKEMLEEGAKKQEERVDSQRELVTKPLADATKETSEKYAASTATSSEPSVRVAERSRVDEGDTGFFAAMSKLLTKLFGGNILAKIGILTLVLGVGFFVKYAIDQDWINEIGRVGIGLLIGALIVGLGHKLKEEFSLFSSILAGGGISIFYITTTLAFREYALFSQSVAFVMLIIITLFSVLLSLLYNRQELALFSLIGGFLAPFMVSTGSGNYIVLFSYILILNSGMLLVSMRRNWKLIGVFSYVLSLLFFWMWLGISYKSTDIVGAALFAGLFFAQFYSLALIKYRREGNTLTKFQLFLILSNNLSMLLALIYVLDGEYSYLIGLATLILALVNVLVMIALFKIKEIGKDLKYTLVAVVISLVSLAIPIQLEGSTITIFWAVESVALLWLWRKSQIPLVRIAHVVLLGLSIISLLSDYVNFDYEQSYTLILNSLFVTGLTVIISFGVIRYYLITYEDRESYYELFNVRLFRVEQFVNALNWILGLLILLAPLAEIYLQIEAKNIGNVYPGSLYPIISLSYITLFLGGVALLLKDKLKPFSFSILLVILTLEVVVSSCLIYLFSLDTIVIEDYGKGYHALHLLIFIGLFLQFYLLFRATNYVKLRYNPLIVLLIVSIVSLTYELNDLVYLLFGEVGNTENIAMLSRAVSSYGLPILWGLLAMFIMILGIRMNRVDLRKFSLVFYAFIIVKFYLMDVWNMTQTGRIIAFIVLGIILLVVSFMQQKIKTFVQQDEDITDLNSKNEDDETR